MLFIYLYIISIKNSEFNKFKPLFQVWTQTLYDTIASRINTTTEEEVAIEVSMEDEFLIDEEGEEGFLGDDFDLDPEPESEPEPEPEQGGMFLQFKNYFLWSSWEPLKPLRLYSAYGTLA